MTILNRVKGIVEGQYGVVIPLSIKDADGQAQDLSAYTGVVIKAHSPDAQTTLTFTGAFVSASGGTLSFTPSSGNLFTRDGDWLGQVQLTATGVFAPTVPFIFEVEKQL